MNTTTYLLRRQPQVVFALALALAAALSQAAAPIDRRAVELTFLRSNPGQREQLKSFIVLNWFAMDKIAKEKGLMNALTVMTQALTTGHGTYWSRSPI